jgi:hypothetical protein
MTELHGGSLNVESELDRGTTVTVRLPAARIVWASSEAREPRMPEVASTSS